jgi:hypothetical protein
MIRRLHRLGLLLAGASVAWATAGTAAAASAEASRRVGPFEITAHSKRVGDSGRWMRTGNPFGSYAVREYTVTWQGRKLSVPGGGERFWQALHLPDAPRPALLLTHGPNLHLVSEVDGRLETRALAPESGSSSMQWLDSDGGQPGPEIPGFFLDRIEAPPTAALSGGRRLYLRHRLALDVRTLTTVDVEPWAREGQGEAVVEMNASNSPAIALSPGGTRFVLAGEGRDYRRGGERFELLLLIDLATGKAEGLRLDAGRTPYARPGDIDAGWIVRHFRWERDAAGREGLRPR